MKRILFVDDEQAALDGLRYRFHSMHCKWDIDCADSGPAAIERMQRQSYDVIVTDLRMPGMDGTQLLEVVSARWPQTIRIVLSAYDDPTTTTVLIPIAHQYLSKPCEPKQLETVISRCLQLHDLLHGSQLRGIVGRIHNLPALPRMYAALQGIVKDDKVTTSEVARLISLDSAIAARVLQIVNSAFFRLPRRTTNIEQAVMHLGFAAIRNIATSVEVFSQWSPRTSSSFDPEKLQSHAQAVAAAASALTLKTPLADDAMLAGLLHDIGYWVLAQECSAELTAAVNLAAATQIQLHEAQTEILGASHAEVGAYLLGLWGLPYSVVEAVAYHHQPHGVAQSNFDVLAALVTAESLVPHNDSSVFHVATPADARIDEGYLTSVNAAFDWSEAQRRVRAAVEWRDVAL